MFSGSAYQAAFIFTVQLIDSLKWIFNLYQWSISLINIIGGSKTEDYGEERQEERVDHDPVQGEKERDDHREAEEGPAGLSFLP